MENSSGAKQDGQSRAAVETKHLTIDLDSRVAKCWRSIAKSEGLHSDTSVAQFLVDLYKDRRKSSDSKAKDDIDSVTVCTKCCTRLILFCPTCQLPSKTNPPQEHPLSVSPLQQERLLKLSGKNVPVLSTPLKQPTVHKLSLQNHSLHGLPVQNLPWQKILFQKAPLQKTNAAKCSQKLCFPVHIAAGSSAKQGLCAVQAPIAVPVALHKARSCQDSHPSAQLTDPPSAHRLKEPRVSAHIKEEIDDFGSEVGKVSSTVEKEHIHRTEGTEAAVVIKQEPVDDDVESVVVRSDQRCPVEISTSVDNLVSGQESSLCISASLCANSGSTSVSDDKQKIFLIQNPQSSSSIFQRVQSLQSPHEEASSKEKTVTFIQSVAHKERTQSAQCRTKSNTPINEAGPTQISTCAEGVSTCEGESRRKETTEKSIRCRLCGIGNHTYSAFKCHKGTKHFGKVYTCNSCGVQVRYKERLRNHTLKCKGSLRHNRHNIPKQQQAALELTNTTSGPSNRIICERVTATSALDGPQTIAKQEQTALKINRTTSGVSDKIICEGDSDTSAAVEQPCCGEGEERPKSELEVSPVMKMSVQKVKESKTGTTLGTVDQLFSGMTMKNPENFVLDRKLSKTAKQDDLPGLKVHFPAAVGISVSSSSGTTEKQQANPATFECNLCGNVYCSHSALKGHKKTKHLGQDAVAGSRSSSHVMRKTYKCSICGVAYTNYSSWNCHRKAKHSGKLYTCNTCGFQSAYKTRIKKHALNCKGLTYRNRNLIANRQIQRAMKMNVVALEVPSAESITERVAAKTPMTIGPGLDVADKGGLAEDGRSITCDICGKVCSSSFKLRFHKREKHDPEPLWKHRCEECNLSFKEKRSYEAHMNNHLGLKPYCCSLCCSCFASSMSLRHHMKRCRNRKPRPHVTHNCEACDKTFKEKRQFDAHMNSHQGVKPFLCSQCGMSYAHASYLKRHQRRCRAGQPRTYVNYHCNECDQTFKEKRQFEGHMNNHLGLKPFLCSQCGTCYASSMDLKNHRQRCGNSLSGPGKKKMKRFQTVGTKTEEIVPEDNS